MITSKYIAAITAALLGFSLLVCGFLVYTANTYAADSSPDYQNKLFGEDVVTIDIQVDQEDWQGLLDNVQAKEWISADLLINGERFGTVGLRTKGNSSLSQGMRSSEGSYSLQIKANKYVKGQTFYGLDAFCLNNMMGDATYMKDYLSYEIMNYIGVATPLANYASVTVNGVDYGFSLMLERYEQSFLSRTYNTVAGQLYNVKIQMGRRGDFEDMWQDIADDMPRRWAGGEGFGNGQAAGADDNWQAGGMDLGERAGGGRGFGGQSGGGSLVYTDDNISSYSAIFDNAVFSGCTDKEKQRVITALEYLNNGAELEKYFDVDAILRYFAAHTVVVNLDSYTSNMQQNYYIYEREGKITVLPWDYGLAFGGFQSGNASSVVNFPIDTPVSGVSMEERPLLNRLLEVEEYRVKYHDYLRQIAEGYIESGLFAAAIDDLDKKIGAYVENDVAAFYNYQQYQASLPVLADLGLLRAQSIIGQLEGSIPSTSAGQIADNSALIDAGAIDLSALGSMMGGGGNQGGRRPGNQVEGEEQGQPWPDGLSEQPERPFGGRQGGDGGGAMMDREVMQQARQIIMEAGGELTEEAKAALLALGLTQEQITMLLNTENRRPSGDTGQERFPGRGGQNDFPGGGPGGAGGGGDLPGAEGIGQNMQPWGGGAGLAPSGWDSGYALLIAGMLLLLAGATFLIAKPGKSSI